MLLTVLQLNLASSGPVSAPPLEVFTGKASLPAASNAMISVSAGDTFAYNFPVLVNGVGVAFNAPTASFKLFQTSYAWPGATVILEKTITPTQAGGVWTIGANFVASDTASIPLGVYYFQVKIVDGQNSDLVATGTIQITPNLMG